MPKRATLLAALVVACLASGCFAGPAGGRVASVPVGRPVVFVALGAGETVGADTQAARRDAWPQVFFRTALPINTVFVNFATTGMTAEGAASAELPDALAQHPTIATVWFNLNDLLAGVDAATYEAHLRNLVHQLRQGGRTQVLVANVLPLDQLPDLFPSEPQAAVSRLVDDYDAAVARVAAAEGAILVDVHAMGVEAVKANRLTELVGTRGLPTTAGHVAIAKVFAGALPHTSSTGASGGVPGAATSGAGG